MHSLSLAARQSTHKVLCFLVFIECRKSDAAARITRSGNGHRFCKIVISVAPVAAPLKLSSFDTYQSPSSIYAITDVDKGNINPTVSWWSDLPYEPVHGAVRNQLFFDWHVEAKRW